MNLKEYMDEPDVQLSTVIELILYKMAEDAGYSKDKIMLGLLDRQIGENKDNIYKAFAKRFGFQYRHDGYYKITEEKT